MELSEWCEQVPHGPYFQPIRLRLDGPQTTDHIHRSPPATPTPLAAPSTPPRSDTADANTNANADVNACGNGHSNGHAASPGSTTPKRLKRRQKPAPTTPQTPKPLSDADRDGFVLLPPFQSAAIGAGRTVLNVGGPVWAMDWLPHDVYRATATAATKQQKSNGRGNKEKETMNRTVNGEAATTPIGKDPLADWRLLALSTHPPCTVVNGTLVRNTPPDHHYDTPQCGRNLVQIWAIPVPKKKSVVVKSESHELCEAPPSQPQPPTRMVPRLVYAIDHESGVAWDIHWSPLTHKMARYRHAQGLLGVLAVAFGDGSVQVFEIPLIAADRLQPTPSEHVVERLQPIAMGKMEGNIQLSVRWSPHRPTLLLTGCSDGSVALWNLDELLSQPAPKDGVTATYEMEPQRRFQDADTVGKQEPFDWGWGWVAVRAVCWSPFDQNVFATTGNDSLFKLWDIREPRICFRSHRIRSTWGLAMQWMDDTSVQISGDQGSLYMYDVLSGSYQKLHFHPQIDSPVWDLQYARKGRFPMLLSSCTSGSLRVAPAKKIFRAPQNSLEFCRLYGEKNSNVEQPHKSLTISFEHRMVSGSAEAASPATREFCERDASLHRVRLSTNELGEFPCFLAAGGHAGLVILMEMQEDFDNLFENYFLQPSKKIGRPRKVSGASTSPWNGRAIGQEKPKKVVAPPKIKRIGGVKLSSFAQTASICTKSKLKGKKTTQDTEYPVFQVESPSEAEYQEGESESDSDELSLGEDNSDDDRVVGSDGEDDSDEVEIVEPPESADVTRMRHEYQMDLSEEDAMMLAIQMSELEQTMPQTTSTTMVTEKTKPSQGEKEVIPSDDEEKKERRAKEIIDKRQDEVSASKKKTDATSTAKKSLTTTTPASVAKPSTVSKSAAKSETSKPPLRPPAKKPTPRTSDKNASTKKAVEASHPSSADKRSPVQPNQPDAMYVDDMDQSSIQMHIYQQGMTEEDALREALRMSEMGHMRRSNRKRKTQSPSPSTAGFSDSLSALPTPTSQKRSKTSATGNRKNETPLTTTTSESALSPEEVTRRLEFASTSPPPVLQLAAAASTSPTASEKQNNAQSTPPLLIKARPRPTPPSSRKKKAAFKKAGDAVSTIATPEPSARKSTEKTNTATKSAKKSPSTSAKKAKAKRASSSTAKQFFTDEELLAIALQTSQIEY